MHGQAPDLVVSTAGGSWRFAAGASVVVGRSHDCDVVINDARVSRRHTRIAVEDGHWVVRDLGSMNGTFVEESEPSLSAHGLTVSITGRRLLNDVSFSLAPRSLMAVVGPSGAGKSTLLGALTGQRPATTGTVVFADRDLYAEYDELRSRIGLVPQSDLLHVTLTVRRALEFGAQLRFPADTTAFERSQRVQEVMDELGLGERAELRIDKLSGGQRKRTSVAIELLTKPALLFLDEPTSGLDPGLDQQVMNLLRRLSDDGRTVVVVTHNVANLGMCDAVMVLAEGGHVAYLGPPSGVLEYFGARDWADVFVRLDRTPGEVWHQRFISSPAGERAGATVASPPPRARAPVQLAPVVKQSRLAQTRTLARRSAAVLASDRGFVRLMVLMPLILAGLGYAVTDATGLGTAIGPTGAPINTHARSLLMVFLLGAVFIGTAASIQEIAKERTIYMRERAIGLSLSAYLASKVLVLGLITAVQGAVFCLLALAGRPGPPDPILLGFGKLEIVLLVVGLTLVSMCVGLAVSSFVKSVDMAMPALVVITMTQIILSGAVPVGVELLLNVLGWIAPAYWAMGAMAGTTNLNELAAIPVDDQRWNWAPQLDVWLWDVWVLGVYGVVAIAVAAAGLRRLDPVRR